MTAVLLVDDQSLFRSALAVLLGMEEGIEIVGQASNGIEAIAAADALKPDVVLMDLHMPELDGVDATRRLLSPAAMATRAAPLRVILLTTLAYDESASRAIRYGASGFLLKDARPELVVAAIRTVAAGGVLLAPGSLDGLLTPPMPKTQPPAAFKSLTTRERAVFDGVVRGLSNGEIAEAEYVAESTVKTHVSNVLSKLGLRDRTQLVIFAYDNGLAPGGHNST
jgi:DNA-binding NarL/FixJ family response regulator